MNCNTEEDVIELGLSLTAKARVLFNEIMKRKEETISETISDTISELSVDLSESQDEIQH
jgi:hypothetical protein